MVTSQRQIDMTTEKRKMILLHGANDNAVIICDPWKILCVAPSSTIPDQTVIRFCMSDSQISYLNVRETPEEIAHLADWLVSAGISPEDAS